MEEIIIAKTTKTPAVHFSYENRTLEIAGVSIPEDADNFYTPLLEWVNDYVEKVQRETLKSTKISLKLIYFNTTTSDYLVSMLKTLKTLPNPPKKIVEETILEDEQNTSETVEILPLEETATDTVLTETETIELKEAKEYTHPLQIEWYYEQDDEDMRETGSHFESIIELPFAYITTEEIV